ncbi:hypothetical protein BH20ACT21_BH20ACT21_05290 [soil metagenome]
MVAIEGIFDRAVKRLGVPAHSRVDGEVGVGATDGPHVCRPKVTALAVVGRLVEGQGDLALTGSQAMWAGRLRGLRCIYDCDSARRS